VKRNRILSLAAGILFLTASLHIVLHPGPVGLDVEEDLKWILPAALTVNLALILIFLYSCRNALKKLFGDVSGDTWRILFLLVFLGLLARLVMVPHVHRILYDEDIYMQIAYTLPQEKKAVFCDYYSQGECLDGFLNKEPNAFPHIMSFLYIFMGAGETPGYFLAALASMLSIPLIFYLTYLMWRNERQALFAAFVLSVLPVHLVWSASVSTEVFFVFMALATLVAFKAYTLGKGKKLLGLGVALLAYTIQVRPESGLIIPVVGVLLIVNLNKIWRRLLEPKSMGLWIVFLILVTPHLTHMYYENRKSQWGAGEKGKLGLKYVDRNLKGNLEYWVVNEKHPVLVTLLAFIGLLSLMWNKDLTLLAPLTWFILYLGLSIVFYAGGYHSGGIGHRFALMAAPGLIILASAGFYRTVNRLSSYLDEKSVSVILIIGFLVFLAPQRGFTTKADPRAESARVAHDFGLSYPYGDSDIVLTHNPCMYIANGVDALQTRFVKNQDYLENLGEREGGVYFLHGYWCNTEPRKSGICRYVKENFELESVAEMNHTHGRVWRFNLYKVVL